MPGPRSGNGLLNALSANTRTADGRSPDGSSTIGILVIYFLALICADKYTGSSRPQEMRSTGAGANDEGRQKPPGFREDSIAPQSVTQDTAESVDGRNPLGAIGTSDTSSGKNSDEKANQPASVHDPLAGMAPIDKWGIKGLRALMNNYPDYNAAVTGLDPTTLGIDFTSPQ